MRQEELPRDVLRPTNPVASGSYEFRDLTSKFIGNLFEGKIVYDRTLGYVAYGCGGCCP